MGSIQGMNGMVNLLQHQNFLLENPPEPSQHSSLDWKKLVALGVSGSEAKTICKQLQTRELMQFYSKKLRLNGIPSKDAKSIAWAIAHFDVTHQLPTSQQRVKLYQYGLPICRANLWRSKMFLN